MTDDPASAPADLPALSARTGLSVRDLQAFVSAWERAGQPGTLEEFLGFVPEQRSAPIDDRRHA
jgi:hypothetical protein